MLYHLDMFDTQLITENFVMGTNNFPLMAIPFFMLLEIMKHGGISERIINLTTSMVGHIKGGLGYFFDHFWVAFCRVIWFCGR